MENNINSNFLLDFLPIEKTFKLKIYAIVSKHKDCPEELISGRHLLLSLTAAYNVDTAVSGIKQAIIKSGANPEEYNLTRILVEKNIEELVDFNVIQKPADITPKMREKIAIDYMSDLFSKSKLGSKEAEKNWKIKKSKEEMIAYIRYVFDKAGTPEEKVVSENVIAKYEKIQNA